MPGFLLHVGAQVMCAHGGQAQPTVPVPRVLVSGQPVTTISGPYVVAGCAFPPPPNGNGPCVTAQFITSALRVLAQGVPVLLFDSQSLCTPTGTPLIIVQSQVRVTGI
jgi:hypothetical protein